MDATQPFMGLYVLQMMTEAYPKATQQLLEVTQNHDFSANQRRRKTVIAGGTP